LKADLAGTSDTRHVLQLSDLHLLPDRDGRLLGVDTTATLEAVLRAAAAEGPFDAVVVSGDVAHDPAPAAYARAAALVQSHLGAPTLWLAGNHDEANSMASSVRTHEALAVGDWLLLGIDTHVEGAEGGRISAAELERIDAVLARSDAKHVLAFGHHPCVEVGTPWLDRGRIENADVLFARLSADVRVRGYAFGHIHHAAVYGGAPWPLLSAPSTCFAFAQGGERFAVVPGAPGCRRFALGADGRVESRVVTAADCMVEPDLRLFR
jgi:Icc protein